MRMYDSIQAKPLHTEEEACEAFSRSTESLVLIFKHSPVCGLSEIALQQMQRFAPSMPAGAELYWIDVFAGRPASGKIGELTGIRHESPQVLLLRNRKCVWNASHRSIRAEALREALAAPPAP